MSSDSLIYLDNAATSWPKPPEVAAAMVAFQEQVGANPGRSGHRLSIEAARIVYATREKIAALFNAPDPARVVFTLNVTEALNLALYGLLQPGDHVITSSMEHNSVMRPLRALESCGVQLTVVPCAPDGKLDPHDVATAIRENTVLVVLNHASNVCGTILPVAQLGQIVRQRGLLLLVDAAQTGSALPIDMQAEAIDLLAFTGHKSLYGPTGTGGLVIGSRVSLAQLKALKQGGTGSRSEREQQPEFAPDKYESGTPNVIGLAGLGAALDWIQRRSIAQIRAHEMSLCQQLLDGMQTIQGLTLYGPRQASLQTATVSFNLDGLEPSEVGLRLDEQFGVLCRVGLHCAPAAHRTLGTFPTGTVRFGLGAFNTSQQVERALMALRSLAAERL